MPNNIGTISKDIDLTNYNTYHLKTSAAYLIAPKDTTELINLCKYIKDNNYKYLVLGNGSNVILPDTKFNGIIISLASFSNIELVSPTILKVGAGAMLPKIVNYAVNHNLKGLEWASGIPGSLGGAIYGNAGAYLSEIMTFIKDITILDKSLTLKTITSQDITYGYRTTSLKEDKNCLIVSATLQLEVGNKEESLLLISDRLKRRMSSQPLEYPSAGSVFRNPPNLSAGKLIEDANLKGLTKGDAEISLKHGNFIINKGHAKASDIIYLINIITNKIKEKDDIALICEQEIIDWD